MSIASPRELFAPYDPAYDPLVSDGPGRNRDYAGPHVELVQKRLRELAEIQKKREEQKKQQEQDQKDQDQKDKDQKDKDKKDPQKQNKPSDPKIAAICFPSVAGVELQWLAFGWRLTRGIPSCAIVVQRTFPEARSSASKSH